MIKIVKGDLLSVERGIIGHQVNCQGVMGSGVAKQVKDIYPVAFKEYKKKEKIKEDEHTSARIKPEQKEPRPVTVKK